MKKKSKNNKKRIKKGKLFVLKAGKYQLYLLVIL